MNDENNFKSEINNVMDNDLKAENDAEIKQYE